MLPGPGSVYMPRRRPELPISWRRLNVGDTITGGYVEVAEIIADKKRVSHLKYLTAWAIKKKLHCRRRVSGQWLSSAEGDGKGAGIED